MTDEGYNCEWSQELKLEQSFDEYLNAWIVLHILKDKFSWGAPEEPGFIFNMSVRLQSGRHTESHGAKISGPDDRIVQKKNQRR